MERNEYVQYALSIARDDGPEKAYMYICENKMAYTARERKILETALVEGGSKRSNQREVMMPIYLAVLFQLFTLNFSQTQIQDLFSFVSYYFRPYMYGASTVFLVVSLLMDGALIYHCYFRFIFANRLLQQDIPWKRTVILFALFVFLIGWSVWQIIPLAKDLPIVLKGDYEVGIVTEEQALSTAYNSALVSAGRAPRDEYYNPVPWLTRPRWPEILMPVLPGLYNNWVYEVNVNETTCKMSWLQLENTRQYATGEYPILVEYLPNSKLVLWITYGEEKNKEDEK